MRTGTQEGKPWVRIRVWDVWLQAFGVAEMVTSLYPFEDISLMSAPAAKAFSPAPVMTMALTSWLASIISAASTTCLMTCVQGRGSEYRPDHAPETRASVRSREPMDMRRGST